MIENEELGLKVAENKEEVIWNKIKNEAEMLIRNSEDNLIVQKAMLELANSKLNLNITTN